MPLQKQYNIKVYSIAGAYQKTISQSLIMSDISFSSQINGGQGQLSIQLAVGVGSDIVSYNSIIRVYETDNNNPSGILIYSGVVTKINRVSDSGNDYIDVTVLGLATLLSQVYYYEGGYSFSKSLDSGEVIKDIIDSFSVKYPGLISYTGGSIENSGVTSSLSFDYTKCLDAIKKSQGVAENWWTVDESGILQYHPISGQTIHRLTSGRDIDNISIDEDTESIVNRYILTYSSGTVIAEDTTSQSLYGISELRESKTEITSVGSANSTASAYIQTYKNPKKAIKIVVNSEYNIETIKPGHLVTVNNFDYSINALQIQKISYNPSNITLELEKITSLAQEISRITK